MMAAKTIKLKWSSVKLERSSSTTAIAAHCHKTADSAEAVPIVLHDHVIVCVLFWMCLSSVFMRWVGWWDSHTHTKYRRWFIASRMRFTFAMGKYVRSTAKRNQSEIVQTSGRYIRYSVFSVVKGKVNANAVDTFEVNFYFYAIRQRMPRRRMKFVTGNARRNKQTQYFGNGGQRINRNRIQFAEPMENGFLPLSECKNKLFVVHSMFKFTRAKKHCKFAISEHANLSVGIWTFVGLFAWLFFLSLGFWNWHLLFNSRCRVSPRNIYGR